VDQAKAKRVLAELAKRELQRPDWEDACFPEQWDFIIHPATMKAVQCTRRAGKSYSAGIYAFKEAHSTPGVSVVIIGLTRDSVKRIFYKDILKKIDSRFNLKANFNGSDLTATLPNGSIIYLLGVDANPTDMDKLLGQKNKLVIIDESAFYRQNMDKLVYEILRPSIIDYGGTICMISTTSNITKSLYYDVTNDNKGGWEVFKWTAYANPHIAENWGKEIIFLKENTPGIEATPHFRRMYLNEWHIDESGVIYKYAKGINSVCNALPENGGPWRYVLGIDLGYNDPTAFVVCAYSEYDPRLFLVKSLKKSKMIVKDVADEIAKLSKQYSFETMVVDNASKQVVEELKQRYNIPLIAANKTDKRDYIELLNSDMLVGNIQVIGEQDIVPEWEALVWDERALDKGKYVEHPGLDNHLCDAFLYAWRWCFQFSSKPKGVPIPKGSEAEVNDFWEQEGANVERLKVVGDSEDEDMFGSVSG
tara:strand:- start:3830 stop:5260 length:1431 start_codon:yes stop_codon:yes gene_type:complete